MTDDAANDDLVPVPAQRLPWEFVVLQVVLLVAIAFIPAHHYRDLTCQLMYGLVLSQGVLAGAWFALGPGPLVIRFVKATLWMLLVAGVGGFVNWPTNGDYGLLLGICAGTTFVITLLLLGSRWIFGWLGQPHESPRFRWQYGLKHLIMLMAAVSVLAAGYRFVDVELDSFDIRFYFLILRFMAPSGGIFAVGMIPTLIVPLLVNERGWLIVGLIVAAGTSLLAAFAAGWQLQKFVYSDEAFPTAAMTTGMTAYFAVALSMLFVRAAGYRLISGTRKSH